MWFPAASWTLEVTFTVYTLPFRRSAFGVSVATFLLDERVSLAGSLVLCPFNFMMNDDVESPSTCSLNVTLTFDFGVPMELGENAVILGARLSTVK
jgi:hypothetical protein